MASSPGSAKGVVYHDRLAHSFQLSVSVLVPAMAVVCGFLSRQGIFDHNFYTGDGTYLLLVGAYTLTSGIYLHFRSQGRLTKFITLLCLSLFNIITLLFTLLLTGFVNVFLIAWVPLMVSADLYFGRIGFAFSFLAFIISGFFTIILNPNLSEGQYLIVLGEEITVIAVLAYVVSVVRRIAEREGRALVKVSEQEALQRERLISLINSMTDAVVSTDDHGRITVYNSAFLDLLDTNHDISGQSIDELLSLRDRNKKPVSIIKEAQQIHKVFNRTDVVHTFPDNEAMRLYINVAPIRPGYQSLGERGYIFVLRDITKEKTLEEEQDEFISVISHELRTPVAVAEGNISNIQLLRRQGASQETIDKVISDAHDHVLYLAKIINDLGTLSRAEQGIAGEIEEVSVKELLVELADAYRIKIEEKGLKLELDLAEHLPTLTTSREYLREIIENFITNAIKYTTEGTVTITAHTIDGNLKISVRDTGIGIGKSDQPHIFEKFYRSEDYRTRESSGTGLGLYISDRLAKKLGYAINFESQINQGSTFSLVIK